MKMINASERSLLVCATELARSLAYEQVLSLARVIRSMGNDDWATRTYRCLAVVPQWRFRPDVQRLLNIWQQSAEDVGAESVAFMLTGAAHAVREERSQQRIDLIWTGPDTLGISLRRTEQALLETIQAAHKTLLIVSFAVYVTPTISEEILRAARRGVKVDICVESGTHEGSSITYDPVAALGERIRAQTNVYIWPLNARPKAENGKPGALHAKCAVADSAVLFVSSANLTGYAMDTNIELGVLIRGGVQPERVMQQFQSLMAKGVLKRV